MNCFCHTKCFPYESTISISLYRIFPSFVKVISLLNEALGSKLLNFRSQVRHPGSSFHSSVTRGSCLPPHRFCCPELHLHSLPSNGTLPRVQKILNIDCMPEYLPVAKQHEKIVKSAKRESTQRFLTICNIYNLLIISKAYAVSLYNILKTYRIIIYLA